MERGDPGDHVDALAVKLLGKGREVDARPVAPQRLDQRVVGREGHDTRVIFNVDNHAVDLGRLR